MIILIDNYDSFTYNLYQYIGGINSDIKVIRNDAIRVEALAAMKPSHMVISPGPGFPVSAGVSIESIRRLGSSIPILGICLGHQAVVEAYGGRIIHAEQRLHGKTSCIYHHQEGLFRKLPSPFTAARYHSLLADPDRIPADLLVTARTTTGEIMGVQHRRYPVYGLQFHPESIASEYGKVILRRFIQARPTIESHSFMEQTTSSIQ